MIKTKWPGKVIPLVVTLLVVALALGLSSSPVPTLAAPAVASVTETAFGTDATPHNVTMPATVNAGDLLIVLFNNDGGATVTTPAGWTQLASNATGTAVRLSVYYKIAAGTEGGTTVNFVTSASEQAAAQVYRITDWHGTTPPEISTAATGTSTAADPSSLNPAGWDLANTLWLAVAGQDQGGGTPTYPVSYTGGITTRSLTTGGGRCQMMSARRVLAAASENPGAFTITSEEWVAFTIAVRPVQYNLTIDSTEGGNVTTPGEGVFSYDEGAIAGLVATPDADYRFVSWTGNVSTIADVYAASTNITMNGNYSITANFLAIYDLSINSTDGGSVTEPGEGVHTYDEGTVVGLIAEADACYEFVIWTGNVGTVVDIYAASTNITMDAAKNVTANFALLSYNLTADSTDGGSVTDPGEGTVTYDCGTVVDLVAEADVCYVFVNWTGDVESIADIYAASTNITMDGNKVVTATFTPIDCDYLDGWVEDGSPYTACNGTQVCTYQDMVLLDYECVEGQCVPTQTDERTDLIGCEDCPADYYTDWASYCNGTSIWRTRDFHDYYCFNGTCQEDVIPESEFVEDCPTDYYTEWASYCNGTSIWRTRDFHDYYCFNGTCQEDVIPESEFVQDCPADYYTDWASYCNGTSIWRTRDFHDYYCFNGTCQEDVIPESEFVEDCPTDYYTEWASYCNGTSIWQTRDFHDYYCFNGTCQEDVIPESEFVEDCPADYYTEWASYCNGTSIWQTRDFHDYYCFNGTCQEDVIPESEFVQDCPTDYYTDWASYCNGTSIWQTRDFHDYYCFNGTCQEDVIPESEFVEDCPADYYTDWASYCNGTSIWRIRDFHDYYCFNGTCQEDVMPESEFVEDCPTDYYTDWASYCNGTSIWRTRDFHDYYCFNGTCQEDVIPESEFVEDCPTDYYTDWASYCNGTSIWRTRDFHDYYCFNGTCQEDVIPESEFVEDCPTDYYTEWASYCNGTSIWRTRDFHDYYCFNGTCQEDVIPESEFVEDCDDGDPCTIDTCENGQCVHTPIYEDILEYYRGLYGAPDEVSTWELLAAADDWISRAVPSCFEEPITTDQLLQLADEWIASG